MNDPLDAFTLKWRLKRTSKIKPQRNSGCRYYSNNVLCLLLMISLEIKIKETKTKQ